MTTSSILMFLGLSTTPSLSHSLCLSLLPSLKSLSSLASCDFFAALRALILSPATHTIPLFVNEHQGGGEKKSEKTQNNIEDSTEAEMGGRPNSLCQWPSFCLFCTPMNLPPIMFLSSLHFAHPDTSNPREDCSPQRDTPTDTPTHTHTHTHTHRQGYTQRVCSGVECAHIHTHTHRQGHTQRVCSGVERVCVAG